MSWPGLTYANASKSCPVSVGTLQGHLKQTRHGVRSTKSAPPLDPTNPKPDKPPNPPAKRSKKPALPRTYAEVTKPDSVPTATSNPSTPMPDTTPNPPPPAKSKELYVRIEPMSKLYSHDMGCFPIRSLSGNYFTMLAYHVDTNIILVEPCQSLHDRHRLAAANRIMIRLQKNLSPRQPSNLGQRM